MNHHPIRIGAPRDTLPPPSHDVDTPPALLQRDDDDFIAATLEELRTDTSRVALRAKLASARTPAQVLKLFQPVQRQFHLAVIEAWCDIPGTPRVDPAKVDSAGLVLRRVRRNGTAISLEGWVKQNGKLRGWARVDRLGDQRAAPLAAQRLVRSAISPSVDRELTRYALEREDALLDEHVTPMFAAPPDVCEQAAKTLFYGLVSTTSSEIADTAVDPREALGDGFGPESAAFRDHLVGPLRGEAMNFVLAGETMHPGWFEAAEMPGAGPPAGLPAQHWATLQTIGGAGSMKRFILLLRQLASEFDAFGDTPHARAVFDALQGVRLPLERRAWDAVERSVPAGDFLRLATRVLLERDASAVAPEMPQAWPALDAAQSASLAAALSQALHARFAQLKGRPGRFDEPGAQYVVRAFVRIKPQDGCPARTIWSAYSEPFAIAPWYEGAGAPPVQVPLPDATDRDLLKALKPNVAFLVPPSLQNLLGGSPKDMLEGKGSTSGLTLGWICGFNIPIITICAFIVLNIFLSLFDLIFRWMFFIKICIPFPKRSDP